MSDNAPIGTMLSVGGGIVAPPSADPICAAYQPALDEWCAVKARGGKPGSFNDRIFKHVKDPDMLASREKPIGFLRDLEAGGDTLASEEKGGVVGLAKLAEGGGSLGEAAAALLKASAERTPLGESGRPDFFYRIIGAAKVRRGLREEGVDVKRVLCPDAQRNPPGNAIEIKRPSEGESHEGQLRQYAAASPSGVCELVNCQNCGTTCKDWGGADCPPEKT